MYSNLDDDFLSGKKGLDYKTSQNRMGAMKLRVILRFLSPKHETGMKAQQRTDGCRRWFPIKQTNGANHVPYSFFLLSFTRCLMDFPHYKFSCIRNESLQVETEAKL